MPSRRSLVVRLIVWLAVSFGSVQLSGCAHGLFSRGKPASKSPRDEQTVADWLRQPRVRPVP